MKLFLALCLVGAAIADRLENTYLPPGNAKTAGGSGSFLNAPKQSLSGPRGGAFGGSSSRFSSSSSASFSSGGSAGGAAAYSGPTAAPIAILRLNNENPGDGSYRFEFETENRIQASESGQLKDADTNAVQGSYSYTGDDGQTYTVTYVADENGFQPQGAHLPVAPAIPEEILKALEQNAADEAAGIVDDGQYRPSEHDGPAGGSRGGSAGISGGNRQYLAPKPSNNQQGGYRY